MIGRPKFTLWKGKVNPKRVKQVAKKAAEKTKNRPTPKELNNYLLMRELDEEELENAFPELYKYAEWEDEYLPKPNTQRMSKTRRWKAGNKPEKVPRHLKREVKDFIEDFKLQAGTCTTDAQVEAVKRSLSKRKREIYRQLKPYSNGQIWVNKLLAYDKT